MQAELPNRALAHFVLLAAILPLPGCWTAPRSDLQPPGEPRIVADHIRVRSVVDPTVVHAVSAQARTLSLVFARRPSPGVYSVGPAVAGLKQVKPGERIRAVLLDELSVCVLHAGAPTTIAGVRIDPDARVLSADPAYRLLVIQYPDGERETFKVDLDVKLGAIQAGDAVVIRPVELVALRQRN